MQALFLHIVYTPHQMHFALSLYEGIKVRWKQRASTKRICEKWSTLDKVH